MFKNSFVMDNPSAASILRFITNVIRYPETLTYIILGEQGPTGKTWLCNQLRQHNLRAFEISEPLMYGGFVKYKDEKNHYVIWRENDTMVIILNARLPEEIYPGK